MWLQKINTKYLLGVFLIFSNFWIIKIFTLNFLAGIIISILTLVIILRQKRKTVLVCIVILALMQSQTTHIRSLTILDNDELRVQSERIRSYPLTYIDLGLKVIWLKPVDWIEKNNLIIALSRIQKNFFGNLDINKYFFGAFPRNKPEDFEKFPFVYLPIFILGVYLLIKKNIQILTVLFILPTVLLTYLGGDNKLGPFILFPFFIVSISKGIICLKDKFKGSKVFYITLVVLILLSLILQMSYGKN